MRIEQFIFAGVICMLLAGCGAYSKSVDVRVEEERKQLAMSEMSGIGEMRGNAWMSEGVSVTETEVHYSLPDSDGKQHITKTVTRTVDKDKSIAVEIEKEDSITSKDMKIEETESKIEETENKEMGRDGLQWLVMVMAIAVMGLMYRS